MSLKSPTPSVVLAPEHDETAVLIPVGHPSSTPPTVHTGCPLSSDLGDQNPTALYPDLLQPGLWTGLLWRGEEGTVTSSRCFSVTPAGLLFLTVDTACSSPGVSKE